MRRFAAFLLLAAFAATPAAAPSDEDTPEGALEPDYAAGVQAIEAKDWPLAIRHLASAALRDTRNADIQNYLGYAQRNAGDLAAAHRHYNRALQLNPRHRGAHEYLGEAYLMAGNVAKAEEHLAELRRICLIPCPEQGMLERRIAEVRARR